MMRQLLWMIALGLALAGLAASPAFGQSVCDTLPEGDTDADGFDDIDECRGIQLLPGLTFKDASGGETTFVPGCPETGLPSEFCLDPANPNLFVIVIPVATDSALPDDILEFASAPESEGGLGVSIHALAASDPKGDRTVSAVATQKAVRITESRDAPGDKLGLANYGSPNGLDGSTIWTRRIEEFVAAECQGDLCQTDRGDVGQDQVTQALIRWILNHEVGHLFALTADYNRRFGGYHVKAGEDAVMTQFVGYNTHKKTGLTTFFIPSTFTDRSRADKVLR